MREDEIKNKFIEFAQIKNKERILDFGCGTGTLLLMLAEKYTDVELNGVDIDKVFSSLVLHHISTEKNH